MALGIQPLVDYGHNVPPRQVLRFHRKCWGPVSATSILGIAGECLGQGAPWVRPPMGLPQSELRAGVPSHPLQ